MQENNHFGLFWTKQKHRNTENKKKHQNNKKVTKYNTFLHSGKPPPIIVKFLFFIKLHSLMSAKHVLRWKLYKNSVFSRAQLLGITNSKAPVEAPSQNGTFATKSAILGFTPVPAETPIFIVFRHLEWPQKRTIFQKQIVATKMRVFFTFLTFRTQIVFAYFPQKWQFYKKRPLSSQPPKKHKIFWLLNFSFEIFLFPFFHIFLLLFPT